MSADAVPRAHRDDRARLLELVEPAETYRPGVLVRTDADGVHAALGADGPAVLRLDGFDGGHGVPFTGIARLTANRDRELAVLPDDQQDAIAVVAGRQAGPPPKAPLVGLALRAFIRAVSGEGRLIVLVDRPQLLDGDSLAAFASVARHPLDGVAVVFALGGEPAPELIAQLPELPLTLDGLVLEDGRDAAVLDSVVRGLPRATREWLLLAAAEPERDLERVAEAAHSLGLEPDTAAAAMLAGLVDVWTDAVFTTRSAYEAVRRAASEEEWRTVHRTLWETASAREDADRLAWHFAQSIAEPDDRAAHHLERSAARAAARGAVHTELVYLAEAVRCSAPGPGRAAREARLAAARAGIRPSLP